MTGSAQASLNNLVKTLEEKQGLLKKEMGRITERIMQLKELRISETKSCLLILIPNLEDGTIRNLHCEVPYFPIQLASVWWVFKKIDPSISIGELRKNLCSYLSKSENIPEIWKVKVAKISNKITYLEQMLDDTVNQMLTEVFLRIDYLRNLEMSKLGSRDREQIEAALISTNNLLNPSLSPVLFRAKYPQKNDGHSDSISKQLENYLWSQIRIYPTNSN